MDVTSGSRAGWLIWSMSRVKDSCVPEAYHQLRTLLGQGARRVTTADADAEAGYACSAQASSCSTSNDGAAARPRQLTAMLILDRAPVDLSILLN